MNIKNLMLLFIFGCSCNSNSDPAIHSIQDSLPIGETEMQVKDSLRKVVHAEIYDKIYDVAAASIQDAPVKVLSAAPEEKDYSNYKDIRLKYKNVTTKPIQGIRFRWYGINAFNEPAEMGGLSNGYGGGFDNNMLMPGKTRSSAWSILSKDLKKVKKAWVYEVVFKDGSKWQGSK